MAKRVETFQPSPTQLAWRARWSRYWSQIGRMIGQEIRQGKA